jgi:mercuric reductase
MSTYRLVIIGAGSAGMAAAYEAEKEGVKALLINGGLPVMGTCLNVGCIPSKMLLYQAEVIHYPCTLSVPALELCVKHFSFPRITEYNKYRVEKWREHGQNKVDSFTYVSFIQGYASFNEDGSVSVNGDTFHADSILIATGTKPFVPPIENIEEVEHMTYEDALFMSELPRSLVIVGGGSVGTELAQALNRFGSKVTLIESAPYLLDRVDHELSDHLKRILIKEGMSVLTDARVLRVNQSGSNKSVTYRDRNGVCTLDTDCIIMATGQKPRTENLHLSRAGIETNDKGYISIDHTYQTNKKGIYAAGDIVDRPLRIKTTASQEGMYAFRSAIHNIYETIDYKHTPYALFTDPQLGFIGINEQDIDPHQRGDYLIKRMDVAANTKARLTNQTAGMVKVIISRSSRKLEGVHILSYDAENIVAQAMIYMYNGNTVEEIVRLLPVFPSLSELLKQTLLS